MKSFYSENKDGYIGYDKGESQLMIDIEHKPKHLKGRRYKWVSDIGSKDSKQWLGFKYIKELFEEKGLWPEDLEA